MDIKISSVEGNRQWLDGGSMFGNAPRALWEKWTDVDNLGRIPLACRALLIEAGDLKILCETGIGSFFEPKLAERFGVEKAGTHLLRENLNAMGVEESDIDYVVLSHLHFDHAGGLLPTYQEMQKPGWELLFPTATYVVGEEAWDRAVNPHFRDKASFVPALNQKLKDGGRLYVVKDLVPPDDLKPFMEFFVSNGHTPGQLHSIIKGNSEKVVFAGDLIPGSPWVHLPITMGYDRYPERLIEEKQELYEKLAGEPWKVFFTHDSANAIGVVGKNEKGKYAASDMQASVSRMSI